MKPNHYIAYWKWADYEGHDDQDAHHSNAPILTRMGRGDVLWLFTRQPDSQKIHMVQRIKIEKAGPALAKSSWAYGVSGYGNLQNVKAGTHPCWLEAIGRASTARGTKLRSKSAGKLCQKVQSPRQLAIESGEVLDAEWKKRIPKKP